MICPRCNGDGSVPYHIADDLFDETNCPLCGGSGKVLTNEEWFCGLSTEEKAKTIVCLEVNALHKWKEGLVEDDVTEIKRWLKEIHQ